MRLYVQGAALSAIVATLAACTSAGAVAPSASAARVRFEIHVPDQVVGGQVQNPFQNSGRPLEMTFTNQSDQALWINTRAQAAPVLVPGMNEVTVAIRGSSGELPYYCKDKGRAADAGDYAVLKPGERITRKQDILWCYYDLFSTPGTYTAQALYQDKNPQPPPTPEGAERVSEEIVAEPAQFQVVAK
jgi:hypothetical protein